MTGSVASLLLDHDRLAVAGALASRPMTADEVVAASGRDRRTVLGCIGALRNAGLVASDPDGRFAIDVAALRKAAAEQADAEIPMDPVIGFGMDDDEREILERYFSGRTLREFPSQRSKQLVVLQRLALEFDVGRHYTEAEVNEILFPFYRDWSTLRRHLVDEGFLDRVSRPGGTEYWRSGGRVRSAAFPDDAGSS